MLVENSRLGGGIIGLDTKDKLYIKNI